MSKSQEQYIKQNLKTPQGTIGYRVGEYMAIQNYELNTWAIELLDIQSNDSILEVGFGMGLAVRDMARLVTDGFISGLDCSELMVTQAKKLNKEGIASGRVDLRHGSVSDLIQFERSFNKILVVNNTMYWENAVEDLKNLKNHLLPGGWISLVFQRSEELFLKGKCKLEIDLYMEALNEAGYTNVEMAAAPITIKGVRRKKQKISGISIRGFHGLVLPAMTNEMDFEGLFSPQSQAQSILIQPRHYFASN